jgi:hypothetical protein
MDPKKQTGPRRVWRMTADAPQGEVLELVPKPTPAEAAAVRKAEAAAVRKAAAEVPAKRRRRFSIRRKCRAGRPRPGT